ncbi:MAG TPA: GNAT family N-acetyltransferase [Chthoniobacterales bacterium]|nr:GNAT family N-acetyltransferase [Chthoniobacterales bacterium]
MRPAALKDVPRLVALMTEFYAETATPLDATRAAEAFAALLADDRLGHVWLVQAGHDDVGYVVITFSYSMEFGGRNAFLDDLFIQAPFRGAGLGTAALNEVRAFCMEQGVRAIHLETGRDNATAQALYRRAGFKITDRQLLTLVLAE